MIIWLNGAFGSGKTQTAYELQRRIPNSYVYDPENAGAFIRRNVPEPVKRLDNGDYQNYPMWRRFNLEMLSYIAEHYDGIIIVPMTITNRQYFDELVGGLSKRYTMKHFILFASKETIIKRLSSRFERKNSWPELQIDRCIKAFTTDICDMRVDTDSMAIYEVAERIANLAGITLTQDKRSHVRRLLDKLITQYKHIR